MEIPMSSTSLPPEKQRSVKQFDPLVLDRTVIAIPLLKDIERDLGDIQWVADRFPEKFEKFNSAIEYNPSFNKERLEDAYQEVLDMLREATEKARRAAANKDSIGPQSIDPPEEDRSLSFAQLHAAVIRRLLALNDRKPSPSRPIALIHPTRFEVMIDLNLEYPGGRSEARRWVLDNIEKAKSDANVRDAGQGAQLAKENTNSQYVFARLEGRAIQALVNLDLAHARERANDADNAAADEMKFRAIFHVWPDFEVSALINKSVATVKADAVQRSFSAAGEGITWAVMDSGINNEHRHF